MNSNVLIFKDRYLLSKLYPFYIQRSYLETFQKSLKKESTHLRKEGNIFLTSISGEILSFPSSAAHHKSSKEIVFKIN